MVGSLGCAVQPALAGRGAPESTEALAAELDAMSQGLTAAHPETFRSILETTLASDAYVCRPTPREVFFGEVSEGIRTVAGEMPHYGFYFGPMHYRVQRTRDEAGRGLWQVRVTIAVDPPRGGGALELPDCGLFGLVSGGVCRGVPYASSPKTDACPGSGSFSAPNDAASVRALLGRWSREAEGYYNRDAVRFGLPIHYDFEFVEASEAGWSEVDMSVPLSPTCGRTPYFSAFRSGWSLPIVAHEVGHVLGLLDEYEALSGIVAFYPKTPFVGAELSRMGLSMREETKVLPLHHYLILRRYFCPEPDGRSFYDDALR
uniref:Uncharacterized protein n=1 Tax=Racemicystis crocea TaxID=1707966 RepID=A0A3S7V0L8_9BACT|nr:hypothetical protein [Racemicystis crocea]